MKAVRLHASMRALSPKARAQAAGGGHGWMIFGTLAQNRGS
jgi:hypothetical protein